MRIPILLARKDLRMLMRTRVLVLLLVAYVLLLGLLIGGVLTRQGPPKVAYVNEDRTGSSVHIGNKTFSIDTYVERAQRHGVQIVRFHTREQAQRALDDGEVAGVLVVPAGTVAQLRTGLSGTNIDFLVGDNPLGSVVAQRMRGVIYTINLSISSALIEANRGYLKALTDGGNVEVNGDRYHLYGLGPVRDDLTEARAQLEDMPNSDELLDRLDNAIEFASEADSAIAIADRALEATAAPVRLNVQRSSGTSPLLTAQALAFILSMAIAFICTVVVSASLASETDDDVLGRLLRGLASARDIVTGKLLLGGVLGTALSVVLVAIFTVIAPHAWMRIPLLLVAAFVASCAAAGWGALIAAFVRDARSATLVALLLVLPLAPLALLHLPDSVNWIQQIVPVAPARAMFAGILFDEHALGLTLRRCAQLLGIAIATGAVAATTLRRAV